MAHGYVVTSRASQGKTVDQVFVAQSATSPPATDARQFYVSVSRGREQAVLFTDDPAALLDAARRPDEPPAGAGRGGCRRPETRGPRAAAQAPYVRPPVGYFRPDP